MTATARQKSLIVPREHGAWGILLVPLFTGAVAGLLAGGSPAGLAPFIVVALGLFWMRTPVESWLGAAPVRARTPGELRAVRRALALLAAVSLAALVWLFWGFRYPSLLWIGAGAGVAFVLQALLKSAWRGARTAAQMVGSAGLTATAPAAWYVVTGNLNVMAWTLWAANLLFAVNQIHFVQVRIHAAKAASRKDKLAIGGGFLAGQFILAGLLTAACATHLLRPYAAIAFLPLLYRGFAWFLTGAKPLAIHTVGKTELAYSIAFALLLTFTIAPL